MTKTCKRCHREIESKAKTCPHCQVDQRSWLVSHRMLASLAVLLVLFSVLSIYVSQLYPTPLIRTNVHCASVSSHDVNQKLQCLLAGFVGKDSSVRSIELAVSKGDGSYSWAGATGIANQHGHIPMTKETPIYLASVEKVYIATAIMKLSEKKALALDAPMATYLPADLIKGIDVYHGKDYSHAVTIRELVSMTSGIADYWTEKGKDGKSGFDLSVEAPKRLSTVDDITKRVRDDLQPHFPPGTAVFYSDTNYRLLETIIAKVTHKPLSSVLEDLFFRPLGLQHTWFTSSPRPQVSSSVNPADVFSHEQNVTAAWSGSLGNLVSTAQDMIMFLKALNEGKLITRQSLETMQTWRDWNDDFPLPGVLQYGYGLWHFQFRGPISVLSNLTPTRGLSGSCGSFLYYSEDDDLYMAGTINSFRSDSTVFLLMGGVLNLLSPK